MASTMTQALIGTPVAFGTGRYRGRQARARSGGVVRAHQEGQEVSRRQAAGLAMVAAATALTAAPAHAFLGFGEDQEAKYTDDTTKVISQVNLLLAMEKDSPEREEAVKQVRKSTNDWVATYRRNTSFSGRASFGNTYSALNAIAGHVNSFGPNAPIPKKRLARIEKELGDAEKLLARGR